MGQTKLPALKYALWQHAGKQTPYTKNITKQRLQKQETE